MYIIAIFLSPFHLLFIPFSSSFHPLFINFFTLL